MRELDKIKEEKHDAVAVVLSATEENRSLDMVTGISNDRNQRRNSVSLVRFVRSNRPMPESRRELAGIDSKRAGKRVPRIRSIPSSRRRVRSVDRSCRKKESTESTTPDVKVPEGETLRNNSINHSRKMMKRFYPPWFLLFLTAVGCSYRVRAPPPATKMQLPRQILAGMERVSVMERLRRRRRTRLIKKEAGAMGELEKKWKVESFSNKPIMMPASRSMARMSSMPFASRTWISSVRRRSERVLPFCRTSTSNGADACIAVGIDSLEGTQGKKKPTFAWSDRLPVLFRAVPRKPRSHHR